MTKTHSQLTMHISIQNRVKYLTSLAKWMTVRLQTKWLWVAVPLQSH